MSDYFSLEDDMPASDEESSSLHRNCLKELALEQMQPSDDSDAATDISEDLPEGTDWNSLPVSHKKHDRNVNEDPPLFTPRELDDRPRSSRTASGVRFAAAEHVFENRPSDNFDSMRPRTAASRAASLPQQDAKMFAFTAEGHMSDWQTTEEHAIDGKSLVPDAFPTPKFVRKAIEARPRAAAAAPPIAAARQVPPLNLAAIKQASNNRPPDAPSSRLVVSSSARSSLYTPRNSERRQRQREQDANGTDFLDSYRQDLVAVFMGTSARRVVKAPPKKKGIKKKLQATESADADARSDHPDHRDSLDHRACEQSLGATLRSIERDTHAYTASPVAAAAAAESSPCCHLADESAIAHSSSDMSHDQDDTRSLAQHADAAAESPPSAHLHTDSTRLRASSANIIEQAALSGIEEVDALLQAEERIAAVVKRAQASSSPVKKGGHAVADEIVAQASGPSSQKAHMLPYLQSGRRPRPNPRAAGGDLGEVDWQSLYNESEGRVLTDMMAFDINDGADAGSKGQLLCKLLHVPKAFTAQVLRAAASAHGLISLDSCRQIMCSTFQKLLEREALLQHISIKQAAGFNKRVAGAPTYADIVSLGRVSAVVAVKLKELRRSMFWIGHNKCFVWGKQDYEKKMAHDMEGVQLMF